MFAGQAQHLAMVVDGLVEFVQFVSVGNGKFLPSLQEAFKG
jgi:hypothetical protein